LTSSFCAG